ncbi:putative Ig domain-containing protein, partial [Acinetobacter baumannii]
AFGISVAPQPALSLQVPAVRAGAPFSARPVVTGLAAAGTFSLSSTAPDWLKVNSATGEISGRAGGAGTHSGIVLKVTDADGSSAIASFTVT